MKRIRLKHTEKSMGKLSIQHPDAPLGFHKGVCTIEITDIPDDIDISEVISVADQTTTFLAKRHSFKFSEIGRGKIIRA